MSASTSVAVAVARGCRWDHLELLERVNHTGPIRTAAGTIGMNYKAAW